MSNALLGELGIPKQLNGFDVIAWKPIIIKTYSIPQCFIGVCYRHNHEFHPYVCFTCYRSDVVENRWSDGNYYDTIDEALKCFARRT